MKSKFERNFSHFSKPVIIANSIRCFTKFCDFDKKIRDENAYFQGAFKKEKFGNLVQFLTTMKELSVKQKFLLGKR